VAGSVDVVVALAVLRHVQGATSARARIGGRGRRTGVIRAAGVGFTGFSRASSGGHAVDHGHRAIREAIGAGSAGAARLLAREHVLSSKRLIEVVLETLGASGREPGWGS
jgi:hypothetical protein